MPKGFNDDTTASGLRHVHGGQFEPVKELDFEERTVSNGYEVTLVEDNPSMRGAMTKSLTAAGYTVSAVEDAESYQRAVDSRAFGRDLIAVYDWVLDRSFQSSRIKNGGDAAVYAIRKRLDFEIGVFFSTFGDQIDVRTVPQEVLTDRNRRWYVTQKAKRADDLGPRLVDYLETVRRDNDGRLAINTKAFNKDQLERRKATREQANATDYLAKVTTPIKKEE